MELQQMTLMLSWLTGSKDSPALNPTISTLQARAMPVFINSSSLILLLLLLLKISYSFIHKLDEDMNICIISNCLVSGHYVPQLAELIYERNKGANKDSYINLKGFMVIN